MHLTKKLMAAAITVSLASFAGVAAAKTIGVDLSVPFEDDIIHKNKPNNDSFSDKFTFSLASDAKLSISVSELFDANFPSALKLNVLDFDLFKSGPTSLVHDHAALTGSNPLGDSFTTGVLSAGSYFLKVSGDIAGKFGGYNIQLAALDTGNTAPVPEPSEYLMFLAGLGVIGYAVRRKSAVN